MTGTDPAASYLASVVTLYLQMPDTPMRVSASDQWLARHFNQEGVPLETVETALLLGSLRRLIRPADAPPRHRGTPGLDRSGKLPPVPQAQTTPSHKSPAGK